MNPYRWIVLLLTTLAPCFSVARAETITVFAAASLSDSLTEIAPPFEKASGHGVRFSFASSGMLARQISEGAPADVFLSADEERLDLLENAGLLDTRSRRDLLTNRLALVVPSDVGQTVFTLSDLKHSQVRRIAIGEPFTVPVGAYAKAHLQRIGLWTEVTSKLLPLTNARAVLAAVEAGNADAGFVYMTDALTSTRIRVAVQVPEAEGPRIVYPGAVTKGSPHADAARSFLEYLSGREAQVVFERHGFTPLHPAPLPNK